MVALARSDIIRKSLIFSGIPSSEDLSPELLSCCSSSLSGIYVALTSTFFFPNASRFLRVSRLGVCTEHATLTGCCYAYSVYPDVVHSLLLCHGF